MHCAPAGQIDNEIAGLCRHGNARIGVVEADRCRRHATFLQRRAELAPYRGLLSGHSLDSEEAHEAIGGGFDVDGHDDPLMWLAELVSIVRDALLRKAHLEESGMPSRR